MTRFEPETDHNAAPVPDPPGVMRWVFMILMAVVVLTLYALTAGGIDEAGTSDPAGNGLAALAAYTVNFLLWLALAGFLAAASRDTDMGSLVLGAFLVACLGHFVSLYVLIEVRPRPLWLNWFIATLPALVFALGLWLLASRARSPRTRRAGLRVLGLAAGIMAAVGVFLGVAWQIDAPERVAAAERRQAEQERLRAELERDSAAQLAAERVRLETLSPDARLEQLLAFDGTALQAEAFARVSGLTNRQADAERLMADPATPLSRFRWIRDFRLRATPALCTAYRGRREWASFDTMVDQMDAMRWMLEQGCDIRPRLAALRDRMIVEGNYNDHPDSPPGQLGRLLDTPVAR